MTCVFALPTADDIDNDNPPIQVRSFNLRFLPTVAFNPLHLRHIRQLEGAVSSPGGAAAVASRMGSFVH